MFTVKLCFEDGPIGDACSKHSSPLWCLIGDACLLRLVSLDDDPISDASLEQLSPLFLHIRDASCYYVSLSSRSDNSNYLWQLHSLYSHIRHLGWVGRAGLPPCRSPPPANSATRTFSILIRQDLLRMPALQCLRRLFATSKDAQLMCWHKEGRKTNGFMRHPTDGIQWHIIDHKYLDFKKEARNFRFAVSTDEMNPFGNMSNSHSVWSVL